MHAASVTLRAADYIHGDAELAVFLQELLADGDTRMIPAALRTAADVLGMAELARRTGLNRETLYRTLSESGNPRLDTLGAILDAFGLRLSVQPSRAPRRKRAATKSNSRCAASRWHSNRHGTAPHISLRDILRRNGIARDTIMQTVKVFTLGKAQAVRIPVRYRFATDEVEVFKRGDELVLRPKPETAADIFARARAVAGDAFKDFKRPPQG